jgi:cell division protein YceG involved in septum cleavage
MKRFRDFAIFLFFSLGIAIIILGSMFNYYLSPVSSDIIDVEIKITDGKDINKVTSMLYDKKLIRNPKVFKIYLDIYGVDEFKEGSFKLKPNMGSRKIMEYLSVDK